MVKKWLCAASLGLVLVASTGAQAAEKVAVVNISSIFQQLPEREIIARQLENEFKGRASELQEMEKGLQMKMQELRADPKSKPKPLTASQRNALEKEVNTEGELFTTRARAFDADHNRRQMEERNKILSRIKDAVKAVASKKGYDVVIDANAVSYADPSVDITAEVQKQVK